jgi:hypothetical protein
VIIPASFLKTRVLLDQRGFRVRTIDLSELQKAEAGVTCGSLIFNHDAGVNRESLPPPAEATACQGIIEFGG